VFLGNQAGMNASNTADFLGASTNFQSSIGGSSFLGYQAGYDAYGAVQSTFIGTQAGYKAYGALESFIAGMQAGYNDEDLPDFLGESFAPFPGLSGAVTFVGVQAGYGAAAAVQSTFIGQQAGFQAKYSPLSTFIGFGAGAMTNGYPTQSITSQPMGGFYGSTAIGLLTGQNAYNAFDSVFMGNLTGAEATNANSSVFIGAQAGREAFNASNSIFLGIDSGDGADNAAGSIFIGRRAGSSAINGPASIFIGPGSGSDGMSNNTLASINYSNLQNEPFIIGDGIQGITSGAVATIVTDSGSVLQLMMVSGTFIPGETIYSMPTDNNAEAEVTGFTDGSYSILIGENTSTNGYQNSIAIGMRAKNTATNQFMIGSQENPIDEIRVVQTGGTQCIIDGTGLGCTSDERLKTNITDLSNNILDSLTKVRTVTYNWKANPSSSQMIGFLAQDLEQYFPQLVGTNEQGQKSVNYANMTPILVEAVRELNVKLANIQTLSNTVNPSLFESISNWLADKANGINKLFVRELCLTDGTDEECITMQQLRQLKAGQSIQQVVPVPEGIDNVITTPDTSATSSDQGSGDVTSNASGSVADPGSEPEGITADPSPIVLEPSPIIETETATTP
jgi:hypothetical protein